MSGLIGLETVSINSGVPVTSPPNRFFDDVLVSYYVTDDFKLSAGHIYTTGTNFLTLGGEYGVALGGGRMASLFAEGWIGERADNGVLAGLRIYFGQRDKSLIERHRQDDPLTAILIPIEQAIVERVICSRPDIGMFERDGCF